MSEHTKARTERLLAMTHGQLVLHAQDLTRQRDELLAKVAACEQKAANWMASPEAAQRLDGYRDLAQRLNIAEQQRDELLSDLQRIANGHEMSGQFTHAETVLRYQEIARVAIASVKGGA